MFLCLVIQILSHCSTPQKPNQQVASNCSQSSGNGKHLKLPQHPEQVRQLAPAQNSSCDYGK